MRHLMAAAVTLALAAAPALAQESADWDARLGAVKGEVTVYAAGGDEDGAAAEEGMPLEAGDRVVTAEGASAEVVLDGGSLVTLREGTDFKVESAAKGDSVFSLAFGSLLAKIQKLGEQRLRVRTATAVAAVRGTEFGVEVEGDETHVGVFDEGKVEVAAADGGPAELLIANQETRVAKGAKPLHAYQLQRLMRHRALMRGHGRRLAAIRKNWKALPPAQRLELRKKALERLRERRRAILEKRKQGMERRQERRSGMTENVRKERDRRERARERARQRRGN
ncbi:MAG: FecR domain-containing protein [Elusimicrobiota bacterium]|nr:FecR domain-containing protein [Elusimicrobiota bacterium]